MDREEYYRRAEARKVRRGQQRQGYVAISARHRRTS
jgi:hypothetical protein